MIICSRTACNNPADGFKHIQLGGNYCRECVHWIDREHKSYTQEHGSLFMTLKSRAECERDKDHLFMITHPELWDPRPSGRKFLCMKRAGMSIEEILRGPIDSGMGVMIDGDGPVVYLGNIWMGQFNEDKCERFNTYEELLQKWEVD